MARDLHNEIAVRRAIDPQSISTNVATVSSIIDRQGYESLEFLIASGTIASGNTDRNVVLGSAGFGVN